MSSIIKVQDIQNSSGDNIINESSNTITIGASGDTITIPSGATITNNGTATGFGTANIDDNGTATAITIDSSNNVEVSNDLKFNSGYGSVATAYGCRAWVNFNGTGTVAIRESGNVSSITDNGTGDYTLNFTTAMPDANYSAGFVIQNDSGTGTASVYINNSIATPFSASSFRFKTGYNTIYYDNVVITLNIFR